ncbi:MAG: SDR family oxidoreductase [Bdellovibrionales bacterium]|nr:SDR family oxidoreductase [Bdellovibrionales bacterium]
MNFLITGAGRGIGLELTQFALEAGHNVYAIVRNPENARTLNTVKSDHAEKLIIFKGDVSSETDLQAINDELGDTPIDVVINNAGVMLDGDEDFSKLTQEQLIDTFKVNTFAPILVTQVFLPQLKKSTNAKVINITSRMGSISDNSSGGHYAYRMSKAALNMFSKSFAIDFPQVITLTLHPGWVKTEMGGAQAPLLPRESARGLFKVITEADTTKSGHFLDYQGKEIGW